LLNSLLGIIIWLTFSDKVQQMAIKRTMTLNLSDEEMAVLEELAIRKDISKTAVIRQALRFYQVVDARLSAGEKLIFEDEAKQKKSELMVL
jgi:predicted transcriptional regulator